MNDTYKELLEFGKEKINDFFKNVKLFENQFDYSNFNDDCYVHMFENNSYERFLTVKELKEKIDGLRDVCKKCGNSSMCLFAEWSVISQFA